ncbi:ead/Ea22-like family protein [Escherichia coli]|nr:ead/Ea22-like family protein [Escherichia coli]EIL1068335.1 ead/Ea22-like family protein [Escherichia coli]EIM4385160.1 ead/Ea22-like family protein [Escherichia coli]
MSEINYQALREAAERAIPAMERLLMLPVDDDLLSEQELKDYGVDIDALNAFKLLAGPETVLALLDERERNLQYIKSRDQENEDIALTVGKLRVELEAAKKRIAELEAEPVSQTYKFPVNTPCQDAPAHIWLQTAGVWPEDGELSELTWCSHNQHHDDTLYVRADLVNGNSQVTPDGWISCSERMPNDAQWCVVNTKYGYYVQCWSEGQGWLGDDISIPECDVINWMPLPEPPQEVNRG